MCQKARAQAVKRASPRYGLSECIVISSYCWVLISRSRFVVATEKASNLRVESEDLKSSKLLLEQENSFVESFLKDAQENTQEA
jgi:hypothetical protein